MLPAIWEKHTPSHAVKQHFLPYGSTQAPKNWRHQIKTKKEEPFLKAENGFFFSSQTSMDSKQPVITKSCDQVWKQVFYLDASPLVCFLLLRPALLPSIGLHWTCLSLFWQKNTQLCYLEHCERPDISQTHLSYTAEQVASTYSCSFVCSSHSDHRNQRFRFSDKFIGDSISTQHIRSVCTLMKALSETHKTELHNPTWKKKKSIVTRKIKPESWTRQNLGSVHRTGTHLVYKLEPTSVLVEHCCKGKHGQSNWNVCVNGIARPGTLIIYCFTYCDAQTYKTIAMTVADRHNLENSGT